MSPITKEHAPHSILFQIGTKPNQKEKALPEHSWQGCAGGASISTTQEGIPAW